MISPLRYHHPTKSASRDDGAVAQVMPAPASCRAIANCRVSVRCQMQDLHVCIRGTWTGLLVATLLTGAAYAQDGAPSLSGTYWATRYNAKIQVVGGGDLPLTAAGKAAYDKNITSLKDGSIVD